ncbi:MAG TPA: SPFH domain-containing protein, partial [Candidatus Binatia bacterium]|nr:SPFH domain-containing protein [Candidatus Binatia bacterium]
VTVVREGGVLVVPKIHRLRRYALRDQVYRPTRSLRATGESPFQSVEGLSLGVDLTVRYTLDANQVAQKAQSLPEDINRELVEPLVQGVVYRIFAQHTVREIFSTKRQEIQKAIEDELKPLLAADGVRLRAVFVGNVDLPRDYRAGLERLLTEELNTEQMRYTLELKDKQVKQSELEAEAEKIRREKAAEAAGNEQIIAARAQAEAMKHVLPFKQKQIEQRQLEAEADRVARLKQAETQAEARRIEAEGEADSRRKLAAAEAYKVEVIGKATSEQLARDGALIAQNPLLIQKTLTDKLSDKISVIIAPPPASGGFIASGLLGTGMPGPAPMGRPAYPAAGYVSPSESLGEQ